MMNLQNLVNCRKSVKLKLRLLHRHFVLVGGILQCNIYLGQMVEYQTNKKSNKQYVDAFKLFTLLITIYFFYRYFILVSWTIWIGQVPKIISQPSRIYCALVSKQPVLLKCTFPLKISTSSMFYEIFYKLSKVQKISLILFSLDFSMWVVNVRNERNGSIALKMSLRLYFVLPCPNMIRSCMRMKLQ